MQRRLYGYGRGAAATEDIRSSGAEPCIMRRFSASAHWLPVRQQAALWGQAIMMTAIVAFAVGDAIAYGLGGGLYRVAAISLGTVYMLVAYVAMLAEPIETIRTQLEDLQRADASIARVRELLDTTSRLGSGTDNLPAGALSVECHAVSLAEDGLSPDSTTGGAWNGARRVVFSQRQGMLGLLAAPGQDDHRTAALSLYDPQQVRCV
jgi:ATP-binding cassette subfamily B protein